MKMFKRLAAVLLAGAMVLAMLTACGNNSNATERTIIDALNTGLDASYSNNGDLQNKVRSVLSKVDENGMINASDLPSATYGNVTMPCVSDLEVNETTGDMSFVYYMVYNAISSDKTMVKAVEVTDAILKQAESIKKGDFDANDIADGGKIDAIGVATYTAANGKTYVGAAFKISGNANSSNK